MAKVGDYTEQTAPDETSYLVISKDTTDKVQLREIPFLIYSHKMFVAGSDLMGGNTMAQNVPFSNTAIGAGTIAQIASEANHPGIWRVTSAAVANTGNSVGLFSTSSAAVLISGGEIAEFVVRFPNTASLRAKLGFMDAQPPTNPTDGAWIDVSGTTITGKTANNGAISTTASSYAMAGNTWYFFRIVVNEDATTVTFYVYSAAGTLLWSDSLSVNIPTATGRETDFRCAAIWTAAAATTLMDVDFLSYWCKNKIAR